MTGLRESQDVEYQTKPLATLPGITALPRQTGYGSRFAWLRPVGDFLAAPFRELPPAPKGRWPRIAFALLTILVLIFVVYFTAYTWAIFDAFRSNAEDMGIMDQAIWNTLHGAVLHQTICNNISDTNCLGDVSRFAIHFEPLMLPISLLYLIAPSPKTLMLLQALVVGMGAYPVYAIASRRLLSPLAGLGFATAYLLYPALQSAVIFDFHAVTLAAAFLMFALYFMLTRNNVGLLISCLLALSTKEEIPVDIIMIGLAILVFQRRQRLGWSLIGLSVFWLALSVFVMHIFSPLGHSSTASRYSYLGSSPLQAAEYIVTHPIQLLRDQVLSFNGHYNIHELFGTFVYLGLLSPSIVILAIPALLINLLSSDPHMQLGIHQYSAELVPFMFLAAISSVTFLVSLTLIAARRLTPLLQSKLQSKLQPKLQLLGTTSPARKLAPITSGLRGWISSIRVRGNAAPSTSSTYSTVQLIASRVLIVILLAFIGYFCWHDNTLADMPHKANFAWPVTTAHTNLFSKVAALIPADASVSAQDTLVPHLSHRHFIYQYPYMDQQSDYVVLDTTANIYPFPLLSAAGTQQYDQSIQDVLNTGHFRVIFSEDGYLVLQRITT